MERWLPQRSKTDMDMSREGENGPGMLDGTDTSIGFGAVTFSSLHW
jgi:hypothetical protein